MPIGDSGTPPVEEPLLAILRSGTPLADALFGKLAEIIDLLTPEGKRGDLAALALLAALARVQYLGRIPQAGDPRPAPAGGEAKTGAGGTLTDAEVIARDESPGTGQDEKPGEVAPAGSDAGPAPDDGQARAEEKEAEIADPVAEAATRLRELWRQARRDPVAGPYCGVYGQPDDDDDDMTAIRWLWESLYLTCLRLPRAQAEDFLARAAAAVAGIPQRPELIPHSLAEPPALDMAELAELHGLIDQLKQRDQLDDLLATATWFSWLVWRDPGVQCANPNVSSQGVSPFSERYRRVMVANLCLSLGKLVKTEPGAQQEAYWLAQIDGDLRGVLPVPLPEQGSWWMQRLDQSKHALEKHPQHNKAVKVLALGLNSQSEWDENFDVTRAFRISASETAGGRGGVRGRAWILHYPARQSEGERWTRGRFIAVD